MCVCVSACCKPPIPYEVFLCVSLSCVAWRIFLAGYTCGYTCCSISPWHLSHDFCQSLSKWNTNIPMIIWLSMPPAHPATAAQLALTQLQHAERVQWQGAKARPGWPDIPHGIRYFPPVNGWICWITLQKAYLWCFGGFDGPGQNHRCRSIWKCLKWPSSRHFRPACGGSWNITARNAASAFSFLPGKAAAFNPVQPSGHAPKWVWQCQKQLFDVFLLGELHMGSYGPKKSLLELPLKVGPALCRAHATRATLQNLQFLPPKSLHSPPVASFSFNLSMTSLLPEMSGTCHSSAQPPPSSLPMLLHDATWCLYILYIYLYL